MSKWTYHTSHSYLDSDGKEVNFVTQLYEVGVYGIVNNDPSMQVNLPPGKVVSLEKALREQEKKGNIKNLVFGRKITVSDDTGLYEEVIK